MTICYIMNRCLVMFLRGGKVNVVEYWWNIVAKLKVNKWSFSKWLNNQKLKILMLYQDNYFAVSVRLNFCYRQTHSVYDQDKFQCYTHWQWTHWMSNTKEKAPVNWHFTCQITHIYENFKEHAKYKLTVWGIQSLILMIKMIWKRNWMTWLGCTRQCKKKKKLKTASYSEQIQILTLVPNKWSRMYCSEYFNVFECLV